MRTVLITLIGPERTSDLVVDADTPVAELLPSLLAAGGVSGASADAWSVALTGKQPVQPGRTLEQSGVLDGAVLVLRREAAARAEPVIGVPAGIKPAGSPLERTRALLPTDGGPQALERAIELAPLDRCATIAVLSPKGGVG
jgi:WXG100 protein secretion system (Wss), protein YukD